MALMAHLRTEMDLGSTWAKDLDKFIEKYLLPNTEFREQIRKAVNIICDFLKEKCFQRTNSPVRVSKVVKGGSSGKGTYLRGRSDADLVVFLTKLTSFEDQLTRRKEFIAEIRRQLEACQREKWLGVEFVFQNNSWANPRVLSFVLSSSELQEHVEFDVLPAFDVLGHVTRNYKPNPEIYVKLIKECTAQNKEGEFSTCFTELQRNFLKQAPPKLKSLIRLIKYWYQLCKKELGQPLPPKYALELLTVHAWECGSGSPEFNTAQGFRTVLELVLNHEHLCICWDVYYDSQDPFISRYVAGQLRKPRPVILDPADPTGNLGGKAEGWRRLAAKARCWLYFPCVNKADGTPVGSWDVPSPALPLAVTPASGAMGNWESQVCALAPEELEGFIQSNLRPQEDCLKRIRQLLARVSDILLEPDKVPLVQGIAQGGSYGRETSLRGVSEGTLVLFLDNWEHFQDQKKGQQEVLKIIEQWLLEPQLQVDLTDKCQVLRAPGRLFIRVTTHIPGGLFTGVPDQTQTVTFQVVPAFNPLNMEEKPSSWTYRDLKRAMDEMGAGPGEFSVCFTRLQQQFFNKFPRRLKDLILLIKYWYQQCQKRRGGGPDGAVALALELLAAHAWEQGCGRGDFDLAAGVRSVLRLLLRPERLCVYWTRHYGFQDEAVRGALLLQLQAKRPVILDPTDPTNNVSWNHAPWAQLKEEAALWLRSPSLNKESPAPSWDVLPAPLFITSGHLLDQFIKDFLQPNPQFLEQLGRAVDAICAFLKEDCFRHSATTKVQKVVMGGSAAKGTVLRTGSDAHLVVFMDSLASFTAQKTQRGWVVREVEQQLAAWAQVQDLEVKMEMSSCKAPRRLSFSLKSKSLNECVDFHVLPAFNALGPLRAGLAPSPRVYEDLLDLYACTDLPGGEFSTCFSELQRNFIETRPSKLKDLIRLVKHWYRQCERKAEPGARLPPQFALELLSVYAWERGCGGAPSFDMAQGLRSVLELVTKYRELCVFWTANYSMEDGRMRTFLLSQIQRPRPVILDPADPTADVGGGDRWCWHLLAREAQQWFSSPCFLRGSGYPVQPWKVPVRVI
ncbi:LOW QUALITY PROTEIN: 2'-5'-oligoadenylate synthase 2-like [Perognathus longimembris pacificus]|uniref:LOW QUALITY PROTEIN: 2'-5'-oligoadenylate synthase 2-like n=1 Tax=Perognathus longimembris pacificus TaxID=214514 RepID=UPI002019C9FD|nr:LOW QUALITY PROTEIN: 2'-5'-oligoadenylate synthase 2-like [Perognathus longimembris pacificus]